MARTKSDGNGRIDRLEEAMAGLAQRMDSLAQRMDSLARSHDRLAEAQGDLVRAQANLVQAQAALAQNQAAFQTDMRAFEAQKRETDRLNAERFARIEAILMDHSRILRALPDVIRDKIGFKASPPPTSE